MGSGNCGRKKAAVVISALVALLCSLSVSQEKTPEATPEGFVPIDFGQGTLQNPASAAQSPDLWSSVGPPGIAATALVVDPQNSSIIYAGGLSGLYKTTNGGTNWHLTSVQTLNSRVSAITLHPANSAIVFIWLRTNYYGPVSSRLMKSDDGGGTWSEVLKRSAANPLEIFADPQNPQRMFTGADSAYVSADGGTSWRGAGTISGVNSIAMYRLDADILYAKNSSVLYKSTDGGQSWSVRNPALPATLGQAAAIQTSPVDPNILYAGNSSLIDTVGGFYKSTDGGFSWQRQITGLGVSKSIYRLYSDTSNPVLIYAGGFANGLHRSTDGGGTWTLISGSVSDHYVQGITEGVNGNLYCAFGGGMYVTSNQGSSWQSIDGDLKNVDVFNVVLHPTNPNILYAGALGGAYRTSDGGATWLQINNGVQDDDFFSLILNPKDPNTLYAGTFGGLVYKTTDGGTTWIERSTGLPGLGRVPISRLNLNPKHTNWIWTNWSARSYQSTDGGATWSLFIVNGGAISEATCDPQHPDTMYASYGNTLYRTTDGGVTWEIRRTGTSYAKLVVDPNDSNILFALRGSTIPSKSTDAGLTWDAIDTILAAEIFVNPLSSSFVYTATFGDGVRRTTDGGQTWSSYNNGMPYLSAWTVRSAPARPHTLYCSTFGASIFRVEESVTSVPRRPQGISDFALGQNFPNPFNPSTTIRYSLPSSSRVKLTVFNVLGEVVEELMDEEQGPGAKEVKWNGNVSTGVYFYCISATSTNDPDKRFMQVKRMLLLR